MSKQFRRNTLPYYLKNTFSINKAGQFFLTIMKKNRNEIVTGPLECK